MMCDIDPIPVEFILVNEDGRGSLSFTWLLRDFRNCISSDDIFTEGFSLLVFCGSKKLIPDCVCGLEI